MSSVGLRYLRPRVLPVFIATTPYISSSIPSSFTKTLTISSWFISEGTIMLRVFEQKIISDNITDESFYLFEGWLSILRPRSVSLRGRRTRVRKTHGGQGRAQESLWSRSDNLPSNIY